MFRNPRTTNGGNYVFIVVGADGNDVSVEAKSTVNSASTFQGPPWPVGEGDLRICRLNSMVSLYIRTPGQAWQLQQSFDRPDLPVTLHVGATAYADQADLDVRITYESIDFAGVTTQADCTSS